ncbi:transcriptional regulator [Undibacterium baiyunense]|uniref:Transcriptional regulator n=1 Tax=Undibacterium baiyunense TaxID=2828731 RepID=A0A941I2G3_9BURK|nr:transcriptional regulator [Undibacterium baiyunense]MBR7745910.1 transcriptional regulator [Undibacterium baiyunense]
MANSEHILMSLAPRHARNIFDGVKHIELRRRTMNVLPGTFVWIYVTLPVGELMGRARISALHVASPSSLWRQFGSVSGLTRREFLGYLEGLENGVVLALEDVKILQEPQSLQNLRDISNGFNPPQFFIRIDEKHSFFDPLNSLKFARRQPRVKS